MTADTAKDPAQGTWVVIVALGITQIVGWGTIFYSFSVLLESAQQALGASRSTVVGAFSVALLTTGVCATWAGRIIDRHGGRWLMTGGSVAAGALLMAMGRVESVAAFYGVWALLGVAMSACLYEPAFAVITKAFGSGYRRAMTALTLIAGFASTVFWPLSQWLLALLGWRDTLLVLGAMNLLVSAPLHLFCLPRSVPRAGAGHGARAAVTPDPSAAAAASARVDASGAAGASAGTVASGASGAPGVAATSGTSEPPRTGPGRRSLSFSEVLRDPRFYWLAGASVCNAMVFSSLSVHLIPLLQAKGLTAAAAAGVGALIGPMQVAGRVVEFTFARNVSSRRVGLVALSILPLGLVALWLGGREASAYVLFGVLYGVGNGVMTIVRGAIPVELFGRDHYGAVGGALAGMGMVAQASAPFLASLVWGAFGGYDPVVLMLIGFCGAATLCFASATRGMVRVQ